MNQAQGRLSYNRINSPLKKALDSCLSQAFVVDRRLLMQMIPDDRNVKYVYGTRYLPFHTQDKKWMAQYLQNFYREYQKVENRKRFARGEFLNRIQNIDLDYIEKYMDNSYKFICARNKYEQEVTKNLAEIKARNTKITNPITFREEILKLTDKLGFNRANASNGLEAKPINWREKIIHNGFESFIASKKFSWFSSTPAVSLSLEERNYLKMNYAQETKHLFNLEFSARNAFKRYVENRYYNYSKDARDSANREATINHLNDLTSNNVQLIKAEDVKLTPYQVRIWVKKVEKLAVDYVKELSAWRELLSMKQLEGPIELVI